MRVYIASDHAGFALKNVLVPYVNELGYDVIDLGPASYEPADDYPELIRPCAEKVAHESGAFGIVLGWSGQGEAMVANRVPGIRAAVFYGPINQCEVVSLAREHNNANILSLGAHFLTEEDAKAAVRLFLATAFSNEERHLRRIAQLR